MQKPGIEENAGLQLGRGSNDMRILWAVAGVAICCASGTVLGHAGAWFVWMFIYGIGGRVVTDKLHYKLLDIVPRWGALAGCCSGFTAGCLPRWWKGVGLGAVQSLAVVAGMVGGSMNWRTGLIGYFELHIAGTIICLIASLVLQRAATLRQRSHQQL
jgi:hypothetical protein